MANLIPSINSCLSKMQAGEKRFARRIESHLEDDYLCWYELPVGKRQRYSDFIILHPSRGLLLLEVKDWKLDTIQKIDKTTVSLITSRGLKNTPNPLEQVRQCAYQLINKLESDSQLVNRSGRYKGRLIFPYGYGVVLSNITRKQFNTTDLGEVLPEHQTICKDEIVESIDPESFQERLWGMFNVHFSQMLTLPQVDRIRWHLFPEIRIASPDQGGLFADEEKEKDNLLPDLVKVMDMQQEQLARSLGEGHRVIHGVAGSGKTLILGYRCLYLAKLLNKPILVLCYNISLAARLKELIEDRGIADKVNVYHFHDWCGEQLKLYNIKKPSFGSNYIEQLVDTVIESAEKGHIPSAQYSAVMIDEGHDFEADWLKLIVKMVDPDTNSLLLLYDDAQSIYSKRNQLDFSLSSVGVQARGRTTVLRLNYRNTDEIINFAYKFARHYLSPDEKDEDHVPLVEPQNAGRHGPQPVIKILKNYDEESAYIAYMLKKIHDEQNVAWSDMCVVYRNNWMGEKLANSIENNGIPYYWLKNAKAKKSFKPSEDSVKIMTMHSSKGLEFPIVMVSGVGYMPGEQNDPVADAKLLYVAMTRSTDKLLITSHQQNGFIEQLSEAS